VRKRDKNGLVEEAINLGQQQARGNADYERSQAYEIELLQKELAEAKSKIPPTADFEEEKHRQTRLLSGKLEISHTKQVYYEPHLPWFVSTPLFLSCLIVGFVIDVPLVSVFLVMLTIYFSAPGIFRVASLLKRRDAESYGSALMTLSSAIQWLYLLVKTPAMFQFLMHFMWEGGNHSHHQDWKLLLELFSELLSEKHDWYALKFGTMLLLSIYIYVFHRLKPDLSSWRGIYDRKGTLVSLLSGLLASLWFNMPWAGLLYCIGWLLFRIKTIPDSFMNAGFCRTFNRKQHYYVVTEQLMTEREDDLDLRDDNAARGVLRHRRPLLVKYQHRYWKYQWSSTPKISVHYASARLLIQLALHKHSHVSLDPTIVLANLHHAAGNNTSVNMPDYAVLKRITPQQVDPVTGMGVETVSANRGLFEPGMNTYKAHPYGGSVELAYAMYLEEREHVKYSAFPELPKM